MKLFFLILLLIPVPSVAKMRVVTTIPDLAALCEEVGHGLVEVRTLARGDQDPHYLEPKPSYALQLSRADLLIAVGLDLEVGWLPVLLAQAHNPRIQPGQNGFLDASLGLRILEIPTGKMDRSMGDVHPLGNPHYWLYPENGIVMANAIAKRLTEIDPQNRAAYQTNYKNFEQSLHSRIVDWKRKLQSLKGKKVVTHHKSFSYLVDWAGLVVVDQIEPKPGIPPSPSHILSLIEEIRREKITLIVSENYYDSRPSRELSKKTGAKVLFLPTSVGGEPGIKSYPDLFETLLTRLTEGG